MKFIKKNKYKIVLAAYIFVAPAVSFAQGKIENPLGPNGPTDIPAFIKVLLEGLLKVGIPLVALAIIYCGFLFVSARGN